MLGVSCAWGPHEVEEGSREVGPRYPAPPRHVRALRGRIRSDFRTTAPPDSTAVPAPLFDLVQSDPRTQPTSRSKHPHTDAIKAQRNKMAPAVLTSFPYQTHLDLSSNADMPRPTYHKAPRHRMRGTPHVRGGSPAAPRASSMCPYSRAKLKRVCWSSIATAAEHANESLAGNRPLRVGYERARKPLLHKPPSFTCGARYHTQT